MPRLAALCPRKPNGIPDAAELMALQAVMQNPAIETKDSGVSHMALWNIYLTNLAQAQLDLSAQSAAVQRAVAAYMTLSSFGHVGQVLLDVETHLGVTLDRFLYPNAGDRWFAANKDMDRDGVTNKQEWDYAVAQTAEAKSGSLGAAAAYAAAAPTHGEGEGGEDPLPPTGTPEDFETPCPVLTKNVAVLNSGGQSVTARVTTPDGSEELVIGEGEDMDFPLGVEVRVKTDEPSWFSHWTAPDSLLDGSDQPSDSFILTENTEIRAGLKGTWVVEHPDNSYQRVTLSPAGGDEPLVLARGQGGLTDRFIAVREGTILLAEASQRLPGQTWLKLELVRRSATYAGRKARIYPADVRVALPTSGGAPHGIATVMASGANTLPTVNWNSGTKVDPFVRENKYAIPQGPGVTWERSMGATFYPEACYYLYGTSKPKATNLNPNPMAKASASAMSVLTVKPGECDGDCDLDHHGFVRLEHAQRYYVGPTSTRSNAELVGVSAIAAPGHVLKGLKIEGGGQVWRWDGQGQVDDYTSLDDMFPAEPDADGLYTGYDLYVEMNTDATVTPVVAVSPAPRIRYFCAALCLPQQRTTIGIGEEVVIVTIADDNIHYGEEVDWVVTIPGADTVSSYGHSVSFTAPRYSHGYQIQVKAISNCVVFYEQVFTVLVPNGEETTYDHWESSYSQTGTDLMGGTTVYKVTILPKTVCFTNVNFKEEDAATAISWNNSAYGSWWTNSGGEYGTDCSNVSFDYFSENYVAPGALLLGGQYEDFIGEHNFSNYFQTELGEWIEYVPVFTKVLFREVLRLGPDPGDSYYGFPVVHSRNGVEGVDIGSWEN